MIEVLSAKRPLPEFEGMRETGSLLVVDDRLSPVVYGIDRVELESQMKGGDGAGIEDLAYSAYESMAALRSDGWEVQR